MATSELLITLVLNAAWQFALIALLASAASRLLRRAGARAQHALWVAALLGCLVLVVATGLQVSRRSPAGGRQPLPPAAPAALPAAAAPATLPARLSSDDLIVSAAPPAKAAVRNRSGGVLPVARSVAASVAALYLLFVLMHATRLLVAWLRTRRILRASRPVELSPQMRAVIRRCEQAFGRTATVVCSMASALPATVGWRRPVVILPPRLLQDQDAAVLMSAIGHEFAHIARRDYFWNLVFSMLYLPISFHPAAALVRRRIDQTRELRCDELVTEKLLDSAAYARSLVELAARALPAGPTLTVGIADGDILEERIMTMLNKPALSDPKKKILLIAAALLGMVTSVAAAPLLLSVHIIGPASANAAASQAVTATARPQTQTAPAPQPTLAPLTASQSAEPATPPQSHCTPAATKPGWQPAPAEERRNIVWMMTPGPAAGVYSGVATGVSGGVTGGVPGGVQTERDQAERQAREQIDKQIREVSSLLEAVERQRDSPTDAATRQKMDEQVNALRRQLADLKAKAGASDLPQYYEVRVNGPESEARRAKELAARTEMVRRQGAAAKSVPINMAQAINIASAQGTVVDSKLSVEGDQPTYIIQVVPPNQPDTDRILLVISATNGQILKNLRLKRGEAEN